MQRPGSLLLSALLRVGNVRVLGRKKTWQSQRWLQKSSRAANGVRAWETPSSLANEEVWIAAQGLAERSTEADNVPLSTTTALIPVSDTEYQAGSIEKALAEETQKWDQLLTRLQECVARLQAEDTTVWSSVKIYLRRLANSFNSFLTTDEFDPNLVVLPKSVCGETLLRSTVLRDVFAELNLRRIKAPFEVLVEWMCLEILLRPSVLAHSSSDSEDDQHCATRRLYQTMITKGRMSVSRGMGVEGLLRLTAIQSRAPHCLEALRPLWELYLNTIAWPSLYHHGTSKIAHPTARDLVRVLGLFLNLHRAQNPYGSSLLTVLLNATSAIAGERIVQDMDHIWDGATTRDLLLGIYMTARLKVGADSVNLLSRRLMENCEHFLGIPHPLHVACPKGFTSGCRLTNIECRDALLFLSHPERRKIAFPDKSDRLVYRLAKAAIIEMPHSIGFTNLLYFATAFVNLQFRAPLLRSRLVQGMQRGYLASVSPDIFPMVLSHLNFFRIGRSDGSQQHLLPYVERNRSSWTLREKLVVLNYLPPHIATLEETRASIAPLLCDLGRAFASSEGCLKHSLLLSKNLTDSTQHMSPSSSEGITSSEATEQQLEALTLPLTLGALKSLKFLRKAQKLSQDLENILVLIMLSSLHVPHSLDESPTHSWDARLLSPQELAFFMQRCEAMWKRNHSTRCLVAKGMSILLMGGQFLLLNPEASFTTRNETMSSQASLTAPALLQIVESGNRLIESYAESLSTVPHVSFAMGAFCSYLRSCSAALMVSERERLKKQLQSRPWEAAISISQPTEPQSGCCAMVPVPNTIAPCGGTSNSSSSSSTKCTSLPYKK